jgi:hypothetical protein
MTIEIEMNLQYVKLKFLYFGIIFLNLDLFVHCRSIFQNDDNMIFCGTEKSVGNQRKMTSFVANRCSKIEKT